MKIELELPKHDMKILIHYIDGQLGKIGENNEYDSLLRNSLSTIRNNIIEEITRVSKPQEMEWLNCGDCGNSFQRIAGLRGPRPKYCSSACKQRAYRNR